MIPDSVVEEVRERADIVSIIGEFVSLKRSGKDYKGLSPFKTEKTPSFFVVPAKGFFHDFSSGESGDVFSFLMKQQGMSFTDAVKFVGGRCGMDVRETRSRDGDDPWRPYYQAVAYAAAFFQERLWEREGGAPAREYLQGRGIEREEAERFGLGYAPGEWTAFRDAAAVHDMDEGVLAEVGLIKTSDKNDEPYDALRDRIVFPIESVSGRVLGFGGRLLGTPGKGLPKYLNSPESPIFRKGEVLYGLGWARNAARREGEALLVEGFMDVVSLAAAGIENAVAPLGTALTEAQAELLKRYTGHVRILFDSDPAGLRATFRAADVLLAQGLHPSVVTLPAGEDPDSVARSGGAEAVRKYVGQAVDVLERKLAILEEREYFSSIEKTRSALDRLLPTLRATADPQLRDLYVSRVAERTDVRPETLEAELRQRPRHGPPGQAPSRAPGVAGSRGPGVASRSAHRPRPAPRVHGLGAERILLLVLAKDRTWVERAAERIGPSDLEDRCYRAIFEMLLDDPELESLPDGTDLAVAQRFEKLMEDKEDTEHASQVFEDAASRILVSGIDRRLEAVDQELRRVRDETRQRSLMEDKRGLIEEKKDLSRGRDWGRAAQAARVAAASPNRGEAPRQ